MLVKDSGAPANVRQRPFRLELDYLIPILHRLGEFSRARVSQSSIIVSVGNLRVEPNRVRQVRKGISILVFFLVGLPANAKPFGSFRVDTDRLTGILYCTDKV